MKKAYLIVIVVLVLLLLVAGVWLYISLKQKPPIGAVQGVLLEDPSAVDIGNKPSSGSPTDSISIPGFDKLKVSAGKKTVGCEIFNPADNPCYFVAIVALEDGTELFRSGLIAPGKAIYKMTLSEPLSAGTYNATLTYHCYSLDSSRAELNGAVTNFILEVVQ